jgi:uncharacterized membrane protein
VLRRIWRRVIETLRRDFVAGLLVIVPAGFTVLAVLWIVEQLDSLVLPRVFRFIGMPERQPPFVGVIATLCVILLAGALTRSIVGRSALGMWEGIVDRIPVARSLYTVIKQFMEAVFQAAGAEREFSRVILIQYPRKGIYSYAFVTGRVEAGPEQLPPGMLKVFVPSTPNPTTGYFLLVSEAESLATGLSVEEAFKLIFSAGVAEGATGPGAGPQPEGTASGPLVKGPVEGTGSP